MTTLFAQRFVLEREIGSGGMARVFLGQDAVLERPVAVKILKAGHDDTDIAARFRREGRTAAKLSHPNIVQVYDAGEDDFEDRKTSYIVMEYVPGGDLKSLIDAKGRLSNAELARIGAGVAAGLAHAHAAGVVHRDVKPHNVLIDERDRPKLSDFGIARALDATQATRTGAYLGTALYSPPEQLRGEKVTPKSDVYSLGVAFYQAATGEPPFVGSPLTVAHQHVSEPPTPPKKVNGAVSEDLDALILDCMNKDPDQRPAADEVRIRLLEAGRGTYPTRAAAAAPAAPEPPPSTGSTRPAQTGNAQRSAPAAAPPAGARREDQRRRRRSPLLLAAAALLLVVLGIAAAYAALNSGGGSTDTAQNPPANDQSADPSGGGEQGSSGDQTPVAGQPDQQQAQQNQAVQGGSDGDGQSNAGSGDDQGALSEEAAAQTVEDFYGAAADEDYEEASSLLSADYRESTFPNRGTFEGTFATLEGVEWTEGPTAEVSGSTATVTGTDVATHTDRRERVTGTWTLVDEGGEWRISNIAIEDVTQL